MCTTPTTSTHEDSTTVRVCTSAPSLPEPRPSTAHSCTTAVQRAVSATAQLVPLVPSTVPAVQRPATASYVGCAPTGSRSALCEHLRRKRAVAVGDEHERVLRVEQVELPEVDLCVRERMYARCACACACAVCPCMRARARACARARVRAGLRAAGTRELHRTKFGLGRAVPRLPVRSARSATPEPYALLCTCTRARACT